MIPSAGSEVTEQDGFIMENRLVNEMADRENLEDLQCSSRNRRIPTAKQLQSRWRLRPPQAITGKRRIASDTDREILNVPKEDTDALQLLELKLKQSADCSRMDVTCWSGESVGKGKRPPFRFLRTVLDT
jgi:hypothetical protein